MVQGTKIVDGTAKRLGFLRGAAVRILEAVAGAPRGVPSVVLAIAGWDNADEASALALKAWPGLARGPVTVPRAEAASVLGGVLCEAVAGALTGGETAEVPLVLVVGAGGSTAGWMAMDRSEALYLTGPDGRGVRLGSRDELAPASN
mgnify:FL=1